MEKFLHFIAPYLSYIDSGKLFRNPMKFVYGFIGIISLILPIILLVVAAENRVFRTGFSGVLAFLLIWLVIVFACWIGFQLWWDRKEKIIEIAGDGDEFIATPVFSHLIQTLGEWLGTYVGIVGTGISLIGGIFGNSEEMAYSMGLPDFFGSAIWGIFIMPLVGLAIIIIFRLLAEQLRALVSIANNTRSQKSDA